ncbi:hypothetical protein F443_17443 [Phytophthora nicotianae P1569]|uniref:Uncharacterized protein n=1 Tax=Phytophthora nicotianae P1569 TaxID=1317065 RepID=V9EBF7_PHYNI|nr:hypothetical protein F443_17443 [Phytophthora nicotianae P1569]
MQRTSKADGNDCGRRRKGAALARCCNWAQVSRGSASIEPRPIGQNASIGGGGGRFGCSDATAADRAEAVSTLSRSLSSLRSSVSCWTFSSSTTAVVWSFSFSRTFIFSLAARTVESLESTTEMLCTA